MWVKFWAVLIAGLLVISMAGVLIAVESVHLRWAIEGWGR